MRHRPAALLIAVLLVLVTPGCGVKVAYDNADRLARWAVSDFIDLDPGQRVYFDAAIADLLYWHRTDHLVEYAELVEQISAGIGRPVREADTAAASDIVFAWFEEILQWSLPVMVELLLSLSDAQVAALADNFVASNREMADSEALLDQAGLRQRWESEFGKRFSRMSGRLTREQRAYLAAQSIRYIPEQELHAEYRGRWQADLLRLLAERDDPETFRGRFEVLVTERDRYKGAELLGVSDSNRRLAHETSTWLLNHLTPRQQQRFSARLNDLAADFRDLAASAPARPAADPCLVTC